MMSTQRKGFLLIETIIYFSLFSIIIAGSVVSTFSLLEGREKVREIALVEAEAAFILAKIDWALLNSNIIEPRPGQSGNKLIIEKAGSFGDRIIFEEREGNIFYETASISEPLNNSSLKIENLNFNYQSFSETIHYLETEFVMKGRIFKTVYFDLIPE